MEKRGNHLKITFAETIKVFDGNCSLRRRIFRAITVPRTCTLEQLLTTALRAFHIAREPSVSFPLFLIENENQEPHSD